MSKDKSARGRNALSERKERGRNDSSERSARGRNDPIDSIGNIDDCQTDGEFP